jgi:hypothetical protein
MSMMDTKEKSLVSTSSSLLDMHLSELEEECRNFVSLISALRTLAESESANSEERDTIEGELYASLSHLNNHAQPAMAEMDRLVDAMPEDDQG